MKLTIEDLADKLQIADEDFDYYYVTLDSIVKLSNDINIYRKTITYDGGLCIEDPTAKEGTTAKMVAHPLVKPLREAERLLFPMLEAFGGTPRGRKKLMSEITSQEDESTQELVMMLKKKKQA